jgi:hypothetical protein
MTCKRCEEYYRAYPLVDGKHRGEYWESDPIQCAFVGEEFDVENWNCQTMDGLRGLLETVPGSSRMRDDTSAASVGVLIIPHTLEEMQQGYVVTTWYKERGATGQAWVMCDGEPPKLLTRTLAEAVLDDYERRRGRNRADERESDD